MSTAIAQQLALVFMGRSLDTQWASSTANLLNGSQPSVALQTAFYNSAVAEGVFSTSDSPSQLVNDIFQNIFGFGASSFEQTAWGNLITNGTLTKETAAWTIFKSYLGATNVPDAYKLPAQSKLVAMNAYSTELAADAEANLALAGGGKAAAAARAYVSGVTSQATAATAISGVAASVDALTTASAPAYTLTSSAASVNEGGAINFTLAATNVAAGTQQAYTITGVNSADVVGGSLSGVATIGADGKAMISVTLVADAVTEGAETLTVSVAGKTASATVNDTSIAPVPTYALAADAASVNEGGTAMFTLTTTNVAAGSKFDYTLSGVSAADVVGGALTGTATVGTDGKAIVEVQLAADATTEGAETLTMAVAGKSASTVVNDTSIYADQVFNLTTGVDIVPGTANNDVINAVEITSATGTLVPTWTTGDAITGGAGTDTLNITQTAAVTMPVGVTVSGVERIDVMSATTATNINTTTFTGLETLNVTAPGTVTARAAATTAITVTDATLGGIVVTNGTAVNAFNNTVTVNGGSTVNVTTTEAVIATPGTAYTNTGTTQGVVNVGATAAAAGAVVVNTTSTLADNAATGATTGTGTAVNVTGGTSITVNNTLATTGTSGDSTDLLTGGSVTVTGNASTTTVSVTQTAARTRTADALGIANGSVIITDVNAAKATADSITAVTLSNYGGVTSAIESGALTTLNLSGFGSSLWINGLVAAANQTATTLNLNLNGLTSSGVVRLDAEGTGSSAYTTVNLNSSTSASTLANLQVGDVSTTSTYSAGTAKVTALNISGDAKLTLGDQTALTSTATITSTNTAGVTLTTALAVGQGFAGGAGADTITLTDELTKAITTGAGDDTVIIDDTATNAGKLTGTGGSVNAGDGKDTISLKASDAAVVSGNSTFNSKFTGFEAVILREPAGAQAVNLAGLNGANEVTTGAITIAGTTVGSLTIDGFTSGGKLTLTSNPQATAAHAGTYTANVTNALYATADVFNIALSSSVAFARTKAQTTPVPNDDLDTVVVAGVETVNITVNDASTDAKGSLAVVHNLGLTAAAATTITVSGNNGLNLTGTGTGALAAVTKFDASGVVGNGNGTTGETDAASLLAVTYASGNSTATAAVSITGGAGADVLTGNDAIDTIVGGAGGDALSGAAGNDVISGDAGDDAITGNAGRDVLTGGAAADSFRYGLKAENVSATAANVDRITDFVAGTDKITLVTTGNTAAGAILDGITFQAGTGTNAFATLGAAISSATTVSSIEDVYVAMGVSLAALAASNSGGTATVAQVINFANGAAAGSYLVINDDTIGFQGADDLVIDITGFTGTLASTDFSFI